jgi:hypothetical protein
MMKHILIVTLIAAGLLGGALAQTPEPAASPGPALADAPSPAASPGPRCRNNSWNPEVYSFYGEKDKIVEKFANIPTKLSEHRMFLQVTQGDLTAEVKFYEQKDGKFTVTKWTTKQTSRLLANIDDAIVLNEGEDCVGKLVKGVLRQELGKGTPSTVGVPDLPQEAFAPPVNGASGKFIKTTVILLC